MRTVMGLTSVAVVAAFVSSTAAAADRVVFYGPPPAWIKPVDLPTPPEAEPGVSISVVLYDEQNRYDGEFGETMIRRASKIVSEDGLDEMGSVGEEWDPETEKVTINRVAIIRDGRVIDVLKNERFEVLRRETNLESAMLDGRLTATLQLKDLRVGDIVDVQTTRRYRDPLNGRRFGSVTTLHSGGLLGQARVRVLWPKGTPMRWRATEGFPKPVISEAGGETELLSEAADLKGRKLPVGAPMRYAQAGMLEWSQLTDWAEVSASVADLYDKAATLRPDSPLKAEIERIRAASADPAARAALALKLVESQVRYVFIGMGAGAYAPASAEDTWSRRFGDCKAKTALLVVLLRGLDIQAEPALVNSSGWGDGMDQRLPHLSRFDHVIVRTVIGGQTYWLDGTRQGDEALANLPIPAYGWALPVRAKGAALEALTPAPLMLARDASLIRIDASAGPEAPATVSIEAIIRGDQAITSARSFAAAPKDEVSRGLRRGWGKMLGWVDFDAAGWSFDADRAELTMTASGSGKINWIDDARLGRMWLVPSSELFAPGYERDAEQDQTAPYAIDYPHYDRIVVVATLPKTQRYRLSGMYVRQSVGGYDVRRMASLKDNSVVMLRSSRALGPEVSAEDAKASQTRARQGYQAFGGYVVEVVKGKAPTDLDPVSDGFQALLEGRYDAAETAFRAALKSSDSERGGHIGLIRTAMARERYAQALTLCDQAEARLPGAASTWLDMRIDALWIADREAEAEKVALAAAAKAPKDPDVLSVLARVQMWRKDLAAAEATAERARAADPKSAGPVLLQSRVLARKKDYAGALERARAAQALDPEDVEVLAAVASLRLKLKQGDEALALVAEARRIDPLNLNLQTMRADVLDNMGRTDEALAEFDAALIRSPENVMLLNGRCWLRATRDRELDKALADCDRALALEPRSAAALDSRALVNARAGRLAAALRDYDAALKISPKQGASLFGRGLVRMRMGDTVRGEADLAAARKLDGEVETRFAEWGLKAGG